MQHKICHDVKCSFDTTLARATNAKHLLINHNGFSPSQIIFGKNSSLPKIINNTLPALEKVKTSAGLT